jgi:hypothetical protein
MTPTDPASGQPAGSQVPSPAAAAFRLVADLIDSRADLPETPVTSTLLAAGSQCHDLPSALAVISAVLPPQWQPVIGRTFRISAARGPCGTGRGPASHLCPAAGCRQHISAGRFMCRTHWYQVPKPIRDAVWATWQSGTGLGRAEHTTAILAAITAASRPVSSTIQHQPPRPAQTSATSRT